MYAELIREAFQQAWNFKRSAYSDLDIATYVIDHVYQYGGDRRYRLFFRAASTDMRSAIVEYRGVKYYVVHDWPTQTYSVTHTN